MVKPGKAALSLLSCFPHLSSYAMPFGDPSSVPKWLRKPIEAHFAAGISGSWNPSSESIRYGTMKGGVPVAYTLFLKPLSFSFNQGHALKVGAVFRGRIYDQPSLFTQGGVGAGLFYQHPFFECLFNPMAQTPVPHSFDLSFRFPKLPRFLSGLQGVIHPQAFYAEKAGEKDGRKVSIYPFSLAPVLSLGRNGFLRGMVNLSPETLFNQAIPSLEVTLGLKVSGEDSSSLLLGLLPNSFLSPSGSQDLPKAASVGIEGNEREAFGTTEDESNSLDPAASETAVEFVAGTVSESLDESSVDKFEAESVLSGEPTAGPSVESEKDKTSELKGSDTAGPSAKSEKVKTSEVDSSGEPSYQADFETSKASFAPFSGGVREESNDLVASVTAPAIQEGDRLEGCDEEAAVSAHRSEVRASVGKEVALEPGSSATSDTSSIGEASAEGADEGTVTCVEDSKEIQRLICYIVDSNEPRLRMDSLRSQKQFFERKKGEGLYKTLQTTEDESNSLDPAASESVVAFVAGTVSESLDESSVDKVEAESVLSGEPTAGHSVESEKVKTSELKCLFNPMAQTPVPHSFGLSFSFPKQTCFLSGLQGVILPQAFYAEKAGEEDRRKVSMYPFSLTPVLSLGRNGFLRGMVNLSPETLFNQAIPSLEVTLGLKVSGEDSSSLLLGLLPNSFLSPSGSQDLPKAASVGIEGNEREALGTTEDESNSLNPTASKTAVEFVAGAVSEPLDEPYVDKFEAESVLSGEPTAGPSVESEKDKTSELKGSDTAGPSAKSEKVKTSEVDSSGEPSYQADFETSKASFAPFSGGVREESNDLVASVTAPAIQEGDRLEGCDEEAAVSAHRSEVRASVGKEVALEPGSSATSDTSSIGEASAEGADEGTVTCVEDSKEIQRLICYIVDSNEPRLRMDSLRSQKQFFERKKGEGLYKTLQTTEDESNSLDPAASESVVAFVAGTVSESLDESSVDKVEAESVLSGEPTAGHSVESEKVKTSELKCLFNPMAQTPVPHSFGLSFSFPKQTCFLSGLQGVILPQAFYAEKAGEKDRRKVSMYPFSLTPVLSLGRNGFLRGMVNLSPETLFNPANPSLEVTLRLKVPGEDSSSLLLSLLPNSLLSPSGSQDLPKAASVGIEGNEREALGTTEDESNSLNPTASKTAVAFVAGAVSEPLDEPYVDKFEDASVLSGEPTAGHSVESEKVKTSELKCLFNPMAQTPVPHSFGLSFSFPKQTCFLSGLQGVILPQAFYAEKAGEKDRRKVSMYPFSLTPVLSLGRNGFLRGMVNLSPETLFNPANPSLEVTLRLKVPGEDSSSLLLSLLPNSLLSPSGSQDLPKAASVGIEGNEREAFGTTEDESNLLNPTASKTAVAFVAGAVSEPLDEPYVDKFEDASVLSGEPTAGHSVESEKVKTSELKCLFNPMAQTPVPDSFGLSFSFPKQTCFLSGLQGVILPQAFYAEKAGEKDRRKVSMYPFSLAPVLSLGRNGFLRGMVNLSPETLFNQAIPSLEVTLGLKVSGEDSSSLLLGLLPNSFLSPSGSQDLPKAASVGIEGNEREAFGTTEDESNSLDPAASETAVEFVAGTVSESLDESSVDKVEAESVLSGEPTAGHSVESEKDKTSELKGSDTDGPSAKSEKVKTSEVDSSGEPSYQADFETSKASFAPFSRGVREESSDLVASVTAPAIQEGDRLEGCDEEAAVSAHRSEVRASVGKEVALEPGSSATSDTSSIGEASAEGADEGTVTCVDESKEIQRLICCIMNSNELRLRMDSLRSQKQFFERKKGEGLYKTLQTTEDESNSLDPAASESVVAFVAGTVSESLDESSVDKVEAESVLSGEPTAGHSVESEKVKTSELKCLFNPMAQTPVPHSFGLSFSFPKQTCFLSGLQGVILPQAFYAEKAGEKDRRKVSMYPFSLTPVLSLGRNGFLRGMVNLSPETLFNPANPSLEVTLRLKVPGEDSSSLLLSLLPNSLLSPSGSQDLPKAASVGIEGNEREALGTTEDESNSLNPTASKTAVAFVAGAVSEPLDEPYVDKFEDASVLSGEPTAGHSVESEKVKTSELKCLFNPMAQTPVPHSFGLSFSFPKQTCFLSGLQGVILPQAFYAEKAGEKDRRKVSMYPFSLAPVLSLGRNGFLRGMVNLSPETLFNQAIPSLEVTLGLKVSGEDSSSLLLGLLPNSFLSPSGSQDLPKAASVGIEGNEREAFGTTEDESNSLDPAASETAVEFVAGTVSESLDESSVDKVEAESVLSGEPTAGHSVESEKDKTSELKGSDTDGPSAKSEKVKTSEVDSSGEPFYQADFETSKASFAPFSRGVREESSDLVASVTAPAIQEGDRLEGCDEEAAVSAHRSEVRASVGKEVALEPGSSATSDTSSIEEANAEGADEGTVTCVDESKEIQRLICCIMNSNELRLRMESLRSQKQFFERIKGEGLYKTLQTTEELFDFLKKTTAYNSKKTLLHLSPFYSCGFFHELYEFAKRNNQIGELIKCLEAPDQDGNTSLHILAREGRSSNELKEILQFAKEHPYYAELLEGITKTVNKDQLTWMELAAQNDNETEVLSSLEYFGNERFFQLNSNIFKVNSDSLTKILCSNLTPELMMRLIIRGDSFSKRSMGAKREEINIQCDFVCENFDFIQAIFKEAGKCRGPTRAIDEVFRILSELKLGEGGSTLFELAAENNYALFFKKLRYFAEISGKYDLFKSILLKTYPTDAEETDGSLLLDIAVYSRSKAVTEFLAPFFEENVCYRLLRHEVRRMAKLKATRTIFSLLRQLKTPSLWLRFILNINGGLIKSDPIRDQLKRKLNLDQLTPIIEVVKEKYDKEQDLRGLLNYLIKSDIGEGPDSSIFQVTMSLKSRYRAGAIKGLLYLLHMNPELVSTFSDCIKQLTNDAVKDKIREGIIHELWLNEYEFNFSDEEIFLAFDDPSTDDDHENGEDSGRQEVVDNLQGLWEKLKGHAVYAEAFKSAFPDKQEQGKFEVSVIGEVFSALRCGKKGPSTKKAFRSLNFFLHPDKLVPHCADSTNIRDKEAFIQKAEELLKAVSALYDKLKVGANIGEAVDATPALLDLGEAESIEITEVIKNLEGNKANSSSPRNHASSCRDGQSSSSSSENNGDGGPTELSTPLEEEIAGQQLSGIEPVVSLDFPAIGVSEALTRALRPREDRIGIQQQPCETGGIFSSVDEVDSNGGLTEASTP